MAASTASVLSAEFRRGLKDLQNAVLNPWNGMTATHEEPGTIANPTQQMVTQEVKGEGFQDTLQKYADHAQGISERQRDEVRREQSERE